MNAIYVVITATRGSTPRDAGTAMKVTAQGICGTIGGGALEHDAIAHARRLLASDTRDQTRKVALGPGLGQCCGGAVTLRFTRTPHSVDLTADPAARVAQTAPTAPLWLWGAGHVGRAVVNACSQYAFDITWIDSDAARFPEHVPAGVSVMLAAEMPRLAARAPGDAHHLIFTYSHDIDLALCDALLQRGFASCGLIGSHTKWARFQSRLRAAGRDPSAITCPIGDKALGKHPDAIAAGTIAALRFHMTAPA